ncbi:unnamed protein product [Calypogeia fissa]
MALSSKIQQALIGRRLAATAAVMLLMCGVLCCLVDAEKEPVRPISSVLTFGKRHKQTFNVHKINHHNRRLTKLVEEPPLILTYHNGPILSTRPNVPVFIIWYGNFKDHQMATVRDFFSCFCADQHEHPSVKSWWNMTTSFKDKTGSAVAETLKVEGEFYDRYYSKGRSLTDDDLEALVHNSLRKFPTNPNAIYVVLTADDVYVDDFCMNSCASHFSTRSAAQTKWQQLPYMWVGNSATQCPGECAWPFAKPEYGPTEAPLKAPNGDVGVDGMIINLAAMLAGSATNPFNNGFYQGDAAAPLETATACTGMYGANAYPGYPGELKVDRQTGASFNVRGIKNREFLVPALWNPKTLTCTPP